MRRTVSLLFLLGLLFSGMAQAKEQRPNVLFIFLDDFGWKDVGYMGSDFYETPHLDKLAAEGMIFSDAYSCSANCAPAPTVPTWMFGKIIWFSLTIG